MLRMTLLLGLCLYLTSNSFGQVLLQLAERENKTYISMLDENPSNYVEDDLKELVKQRKGPEKLCNHKLGIMR